MGTGVGLGDAVFPAGAGMNRLLLGLLARADRVPRGSGDEPMTACGARKACSCSPRERG